MYCLCGSTVCSCEVVCRCCPMRCRCRCLQCFELRGRRGVYCDHCGGFVNAIMCEPIYEWTRTGIYPNLDFLRSNPTQQSNSGSDERTDLERSIAQVPPNSQREPEIDESLIFQMDDIDDPPELSTNASTQAAVSFTEHSLVTPNITVLNTRQSQISDMPIRRNALYSQTSPNADAQRLSESNDIETSICNPNSFLSKGTESNSSEIQISQDLPGCSKLSPNIDFSRPRSTYETERQSLDNLTKSVSEWISSHVREMPISQDLPRCSRHNPNESVSKPEESQMTECVWSMIPSPSNEYVSERTESHVNEMSIPHDLPGCSRYNPNDSVSKPEEPQLVADALYMSSPSNEYFRDSLPSLPSTSSCDGSPPSHFSVDSRSPTRRLSTSAPSIYDIPESASDSQSLNQESLVTSSVSETSSTSHLPELETLKISDSTDKIRTMSESSSSIETLPSDMPNGAGNINGHIVLPSICVTSASLNNASVHNTPEQIESVKLNTSQTQSTANWLKLPSPEMSKTARRRKSSDSSIETLSKDPANEASDDEHTTDMSPKKDT